MHKVAWRGKELVVYHHRTDMLAVKNATYVVRLTPEGEYGLHFKPKSTTVASVALGSQAAKRGVRSGHRVVQINGDKASPRVATIALKQLRANRRSFDIVLYRGEEASDETQTQVEAVTINDCHFAAIAEVDEWLGITTHITLQMLDAVGKEFQEGRRRWIVHSFHYDDSLQLVLGFYYPTKSKRNKWREQDCDRSTSAEVLEWIRKSEAAPTSECEDDGEMVDLSTSSDMREEDSWPVAPHYIEDDLYTKPVNRSDWPDPIDVPVFEPRGRAIAASVNTFIKSKQWRHEYGRIGNGNVTNGDLRTLLPQKWLNDTIINVYMAHLDARFKVMRLFHSHFFERLSPKHTILCHSNVERWTQGRGRPSLFAREQFGLPVNVNASHWLCIIVDLRVPSVTYADSLSKRRDEARELRMDIMIQYVHAEATQKAAGFLGRPPCTLAQAWLARKFKPNDWKRTPRPSSCPQQKNGYDCGLFTMARLGLQAAGLPETSFEQSKANDFRTSLALFILKECGVQHRLLENNCDSDEDE